jgi:hypothetical protein
LGLPANEVLAIEDSPVGVQACVAAGVPVVVTRSVYFAGAQFPGALAVGPGLGLAEGWSPALRSSRLRIDLDALQECIAPSPFGRGQG